MLREIVLRTKANAVLSIPTRYHAYLVTIMKHMHSVPLPQPGLMELVPKGSMSGTASDLGVRFVISSLEESLNFSRLQFPHL